jgi:hypothetical protein
MWDREYHMLDAWIVTFRSVASTRSACRSRISTACA